MTDILDESLALTAAECAQRLGVTIRALRLYEKRGLIAPRRTAKSWRVYGAKEFACLHEVIALKQLGLSLSQIAALVKGRPVDLERALAVQHSALLAQWQCAEAGLALIITARAKLAAGERLAIADIIGLIQGATEGRPALDLIAVRRYEQARPRQAIAIDPATLDIYVGFYLTERGELLSLTRRGDNLQAELNSQSSHEFLAEAPHSFFSNLLCAQLVFRVSTKEVASVVVHHGGHEINAARISEAEASAIKRDQEQRIAENAPHPGGEKALRRFIEQQQSGSIDLSTLTHEIAASVEDQAPLLVSEFQHYGVLRALHFVGVGRDGLDVYDAEFANSQTRWRIGLTRDGVISAITFNSLP